MSSVILYGNVTRNLFQVWSERAESANKLQLPIIASTLQDMDIYPSSSQVHEMVQCANECSKRQNSDYITFGEFCIFASEFALSYENKVPRPTPLSKCTKSRGTSSRRRSGISSRSSRYDGSPKYEVFLGGSCNPTTWRKDIAIPMLKNLRIPYYNPQVAVWGPELIELENQAKENAQVMFFVIDNQTRSVASMIEASQIAGTQRKLILVIHEFDKPDPVVMGERVSEKELRDLRQGHRYLQDIVERQGIPVFSKIPHAVQCTATVLQKNINPQDLTIEDANYKVKKAYLQIGDKLIKLREVFDDLDSTNSGKITLKDVCMAFKILTCNELPIENLKSIVASQKGLNSVSDDVFDSINLDDIEIDFNNFCCIMTEFRNHTKYDHKHLETLKNKASHLLCSVMVPLSKLLYWSRSDSKNYLLENQSDYSSFTKECRNIYLGGSSKPCTWREDIAIPLLKTKGLTYFIPQDGVWSERLIPLESSNIESSEVLLFVITKDSRSLAQMILAAHYVGLNCKVVLCIQYIAEDTEIDGEKLSTQAVKDYNRGRMYLSDIATRAGVPVFENIKDSVKCAMNLCLTNH